MPAAARARDSGPMLFLFFGIGTKIKVRGAAGERTCPRCHNTTPWQRLERYSYLSLFFVRLLRWHREELDVCPVCGHAEAHRRTLAHRPQAVTA